MERNGKGDLLFDSGMFFGIGVGLFDALNAISLGAPDSVAYVALVTLLFATFIYGIFGGLIFFLLSYLFKASALESNKGNSITATVTKKIIQLCVIVMGVSLLGFIVGRTVEKLFSLSSHHIVIAFFGFAATILALSLGWRMMNIFLNSWVKRAFFISGTFSFVFLATLFLGSNGMSDEIDAGQGADQSSAAVSNAESPNVVMIVMDAVRSDHLAVYGYNRNTTPFLSHFAQESTVYERAISAAPWTLPSHASMFTGQLPSLHQTTFEHRLLNDELVTIAEILRKRGYATAAFSANPNVSSTFNFHQGFDNFYEIFRIHGMWGIKGVKQNPMFDLFIMRFVTKYFQFHKGDEVIKGSGDLNQYVKKWLESWRKKSASQPFFIFINYMDAHLPYNPPEPYRGLFLNEALSPAVKILASKNCYPEVWRLMGIKGSMTADDYRQLNALYDGSIAYLDEIIRQLIEYFSQQRILDNTLLIITSDHGENLGEHGGLLNHSFSMHQTLLHVPLIIKYPHGQARNVRYHGLVSTVGIFSTILDQTYSAPDSEWTPQYESLLHWRKDAELKPIISEYELPLLELNALASVFGVDVRKYAVRQRAIQNSRWKIIWRSEGSPELYDLVSDPGELTPMSAYDSQTGGMLLRELDAWSDSLRPKTFRIPDHARSMDKQTRESLRSLGYVR